VFTGGNLKSLKACKWLSRLGEVEAMGCQKGHSEFRRKGKETGKKGERKREGEEVEGESSLGEVGAGRVAVYDGHYRSPSSDSGESTWGIEGNRYKKSERGGGLSP